MGHKEYDYRSSIGLQGVTLEDYVHKSLKKSHVTCRIEDLGLLDAEPLTRHASALPRLRVYLDPPMWYLGSPNKSPNQKTIANTKKIHWSA